VFPILYLGLPIGALVAVRTTGGREAVLLLLATIMVSDTAQYYGGRWLGKTPLAPAISPKKTVGGALFGLAAGTALMMLDVTPVLDQSTVSQRALLGVAIVGLGIAGDLFESQLKRGAGVKDASALIPGHGGVLDRIDSLLFAAPGFYLFLQLGA
jgi:phosphatidate cytidylyltransferase